MNSRHLRRVFAGLLPLFLAVHEVAAQQAAGAGPQDAMQSSQTAEGETSLPLDAFCSVGSGMALANHLNELGWNEAQVSAFIDGIRAAFRGKPYPTNDAARRISDRIFQQIAEVESREREQEFSKPGRLGDYLKEMCKRLKLERSDSGLCYGIEPGTTSSRPGPDDTVVVSCAAFAADGATPLPQLTNQKAQTKVADMLPGFVEGIQMMSVGGQGVFILPPALSFGNGNWPSGVDRGTPIIFRIKLISVISGETQH
jgi:FKBP-type peptidyl-prolyl cis-trans isomerase FkpA